MNPQAVRLNARLDVRLFNEFNTHRLQIVKYTKTEIKMLCIDDLVDNKGNASARLQTIITEITKD